VKYDPQVRLIAPHITLMFPVSDSIGEENLVHHLENVLKDWRSFPIHLQGVHLSWDDYVFLLVQAGKNDIIRLHDEMYTGILARELRKDIPFIPHLTLGRVPKDPQGRKHILKEAEELRVDHHCVLEAVHLVKVDDDRSNIVWSKKFLLFT
jgi:2'-5' RNA ligase